MERNPTLNVKFSELKNIFESLGIDTKYIVPIFMAAKDKSPVNRKLVGIKSKINYKEVSKILTANNENTILFLQGYQKFILETRKKSIEIKQNTTEWKYLQACSEIFTEFCEKYEKKPTENIDYFLKISYICSNKKISLKTLPYFKEKIFEEHEIRHTIQSDQNKDLSLQLFNIYLQKLKQAGKNPDLFKTNKVYVHFVNASKDCLQSIANANRWIEAQFEGLSFLDVIPEPGQLHGLKAQQRYRNFTLKK